MLQMYQPRTMLAIAAQGQQQAEALAKEVEVFTQALKKGL